MTRMGLGSLMMALALLALLALPLMAGCGALTAPGGQGVLKLPTDKGVMEWRTNRDTVIERATLNPTTGQFELVGYNGNGSTLGKVQGDAVVEAQKIWMTGLVAGMQTFRGQPITGLPAASPATAEPIDYQRLAKAILAAQQAASQPDK